MFGSEWRDNGSEEGVEGLAQAVHDLGDKGGREGEREREDEDERGGGKERESSAFYCVRVRVRVCVVIILTHIHTVHTEFFFLIVTELW